MARSVHRASLHWIAQDIRDPEDCAGCYAGEGGKLPDFGNRFLSQPGTGGVPVCSCSARSHSRVSDTKLWSLSFLSLTTVKKPIEYQNEYDNHCGDDAAVVW